MMKLNNVLLLNFNNYLDIQNEDVDLLGYINKFNFYLMTKYKDKMINTDEYLPYITYKVYDSKKITGKFFSKNRKIIMITPRSYIEYLKMSDEFIIYYLTYKINLLVKKM